MRGFRNLTIQLVALWFFAQCAACGSSGDSDVGAADAAVDAADEVSVRFVLDVSNDVPESIYLQLNDDNGELSWVQVYRDGGRVYLTDRTASCPIADQARVRDITGGGFSGSIELSWDGYEYPGPDCSGVAADPGDYTATFCFSLAATFDPGQGDPAGANGTPGTLIDPSCVDVDFRLPEDTTVTYSIIGG